MDLAGMWTIMTNPKGRLLTFAHKPWTTLKRRLTHKLHRHGYGEIL